MPLLCQVISHFCSFSSCWPFILHSPGSQTTSFFIPISPFVDTSGSCPLLSLSNKLIHIPYSKPTMWFIEQKSAFALHCLSETDLEDDIINELLYLNCFVLLSKVSRKWQGAFGLEGGQLLLQSLSSHWSYVFASFCCVGCTCLFLGSGGRFLKGHFATDNFHKKKKPNPKPSTEQRWYSGMEKGGWAGHWKCCKPRKYCHSNFADSRGSRLHYSDHWN